MKYRVFLPGAFLLGALFSVMLFSGTSAGAQGVGVQFVNFEAPAHKPIVVVDVGGIDYLLVANGPDNSVEVYDTALNRFLFRVPVGQRPVTIAVRPTPEAGGGREIYVANWLGNSITVFVLEPGNPPIFRLVRTALVGDEPVGITFVPENPWDPNTLPGGLFHEMVIVTFSAPAAWGAFAPGTLALIASSLELFDNVTAATIHGVRDPRAVLFAPPPRHDGPYLNQLWILNFRGGNDPEYDFDLWGTDNLVVSATNGGATLPAHGGLGTTNFNMTFADNGHLWVVGVKARNKDLPNFVDSIGEPFHLAQTVSETGFVVSFLARLKDPTTTAAPEVLDLNDSTQGTSTPPMQSSRPVTQPTDVVVYGSGDPFIFEDPFARAPDTKMVIGETEEEPLPIVPTRVFVTGMGSDTLAAVEPTNNGPATWKVRRIDVSDPTNAFSLGNPSGVMRGPRGLALKASGTANDPSDRLYVYNRMSQSVTIVDPNFTSAAQAVVGHFALRGQVEPDHVIAGRKFIHSSKLSAGKNVSCASCHIDGNTDFLAWNLSDGNAVPDPANPGGAVPLPDALGPNPGIKGPMVTQPLRGLVNFEVADDAIQDDFYSNRPYHWRGDKGFLEQFNAAFVNLMGLNDIAMNPPNPGFHEGLETDDMTRLRDYVFSIHYPPNPLQPSDRTYTGDVFDPDNPPITPNEELDQMNDPLIGSGGQWGLKLFHVSNSDGVACNICHSLPEGSNNLFTEAFLHQESTLLEAQNMETAQLKGMVLKERRLVRFDGTMFQTLPAGNQAVTHEFGLFHTGENTAAIAAGPVLTPFANSVNDFISFFGGFNAAQQDALSHYVRQFDTGVAPLAGFGASVDVPGFNPGTAVALAGWEAQAEMANAGLAVHARVNGVLHGLWYDVPQQLYREEPQTGVPSIGPLTTSQLLGFLQNNPDPTNLLTVHATPLGSARRVARVQGGLAAPRANTAPQNVQLLPCPPMSANVHVPLMVNQWAERILDLLGNAVLDFVSNPGTSNSGSLVHFQLSLLNHAPGGYGLTRLRHEPPRRFQVAGEDILEGAFLRLYPPTAADFVGVTGGQAPTTVPTPTSHPDHFLLPLYPARDGGDVVWETAVEMDPVRLLYLMNGGAASSWAQTALDTPDDPNFQNLPKFTLQTTDLMQPTVFNFFYVVVENVTPTGIQASVGSWQRLTITP